MNLYGMAIGTLTSVLVILSSTPCFAEEQSPPVENQLLQRGEQEAARGNWHEAARQFYEAISEDEKNAIGFYDLGIAYLHLEDLGKARIAEEQAIDLKPDFVNAYIQLATILSKTGDAALAENALRKALEIEPDNQTAQANLKALLEVKEKPDSVRTSPAINAAKPVENGTRPDEPAAPREDSPIKTNATAVSNVLQEGATALNSDEILLREVQCGKAVKPELALHLEEAATALRNDQLETAKKLLNQVIEEDSTVSCAYASLGAIMGMQGNYDSEIAKEKIALELDDHNAAAHCNLAWALAHKNRWQEALQENERALDLEPAFMVAGVGKALAQRELGFSNQAKETLKILIESNASEVLPRLAMSAILESEGAIEASQAELSAALKIKPESLTLKRWLAAAKLKQQNWSGAQETYRQMIEANAHDAQAWLGLGLALDRMGNQSDSLEALNKAVQLSPESAAAHMALGLALGRKGDSVAAAQELKEAHRLNPTCDLAEADLQKRESGVK